MHGLSFISFPSVNMQGSLIRQILIGTIYHILPNLGYLGQLNFTVESKFLAQTFGKINPVCEDSLNDI